MKAAKNPAPAEAFAPGKERVVKVATPLTLTLEDLKTLRAPFDKDRLGVKVQSLSKDKSRALLVLYLQHTDVQDRLEEVDPAWHWEIVAEERTNDTVYIRGRLTIKGVARENVGEGNDPKAAASDSLKRCAMLFGVGRYLYDSPTVWTAYDEAKDRFRQWTVEDYEKPPRGSTKAQAAAAAPSSEANKNRPREELNRVLMNLYRPYLTQFPQTQFSEILKSRYNVGETRLMTIEQLEDLVKFMESKLQSVA